MFTCLMTNVPATAGAIPTLNRYGLRLLLLLMLGVGFVGFRHRPGGRKFMDRRKTCTRCCPAAQGERKVVEI